MMTEINGSCSTGEAELDPLEGVEDDEDAEEVCVVLEDVLLN
jgi:hypothetical protein